MLRFAQISAMTVAPASTRALPVSVRRNVRSGVSIRRAQAVRPDHSPPPSEPEDSGAFSASLAGIWQTGASPAGASDAGDSLTSASQPAGVDDAPQETAGAFVRRLAEQLRRRSLLDDLPVREEAHAAGDIAREPHLVRGDQHRHPAFGQFPDHVEDFGY